MSTPARFDFSVQNERFLAAQRAQEHDEHRRAKELAKRALGKRRPPDTLVELFALLGRALQGKLFVHEAKTEGRAESLLRETSKELLRREPRRARAKSIVPVSLSLRIPPGQASAKIKREFVQREIERASAMNPAVAAFAKPVWRDIQRDLDWLEEQRALGREDVPR